jgi:pimeloyl-ACP methyl ester carboxylesterase
MDFRMTLHLGLLAAAMLSSTAHARPTASEVADARPAPAGTYARVDCKSIDVPDAVGVECGRLQVPERHGGNGAVTLSLPVVVMRRSGAEPTDDPILYLHGGPGIATLEVVPAWLESPTVEALRAGRDMVLFDQRGSGKSTPAICPGFDAALDKLEAEAPSAAIELRRKREAASACRKSMAERGRDAAAYSSTAIADDAEALRQALGYRQWNVLATSFGSLPAFELARRHPARVRSIIFNSVFAPNSPNRAEQVGALAEGLAALQARCNLDETCRATYPDMRKDAASAIARYDRGPLKTADGQVSGSTFLGTAWNLLVRGKTAAAVPELLKRAAAGDDAMVLKVAGPFSGPHTFGTTSYAQKWLVECHDIYPRPSAPAIRKAVAAHPDLAQDMDPDQPDQVCAALQPGQAPAAFFDATPVSIPALVYAGEYDPATPTSDATAAMRMLANGTLVSVAGASHAALGTDDCTRGIALRFLDDPTGDADISCVARMPAPVVPGPAVFDEFFKAL